MLDSPATTSSSPFFGTVGVVAAIRFLSRRLVFLLTCIEMLPDRAGCAFTAARAPAQQPTFIPYPRHPFQRALFRPAVPLSAARPALLPVPPIYNNPAPAMPITYVIDQHHRIVLVDVAGPIS